MPKYKITTATGTYMVETEGGGVTDNRSGMQVASDQANAMVGGVGEFFTGLPGMAASAVNAAADLGRPGGMQRNVDRGMAAFQGAKDTVKPFINDATNLYRSLTDQRSNTPQSTPKQQQGYANAVGQNAVPVLAGALGKYAPSAARAGLDAITTPEARAAAAEAARADLSPLADAISGNTSHSGLIHSGIRLGSHLIDRASIPMNEALAKFMANGKPYGINRPPTFTEPDATPATPNTSGPSADLTALKDALERQRLRNVGEAEAKGRMDPRQMNNPPQFTEPSVGESYPGSSSRGKINPVRPDYSNALARAIEENQAKPPQVLDGPSVNKWMGTRPNDLIRGADPGKFLVDEGLIGVDKAATLQKVIPALQKAETDLGQALEAAGEDGKVVNAKSVFDKAIENANKPFAKGTDAAFDKQLAQLSHDATSQVEDLSQISPAQTQDIKIQLRKTIDWDAKETTPIQKVYKQIYAGLNDELGKVNPTIRTTQSRWQNLDLATKRLQGSMRTNLVGKGTNPNPLAEALKKRNP